MDFWSVILRCSRQPTSLHAVYVSSAASQKVVIQSVQRLSWKWCLVVWRGKKGEASRLCRWVWSGLGWLRMGLLLRAVARASEKLFFLLYRLGTVRGLDRQWLIACINNEHHSQLLWSMDGKVACRVQVVTIYQLSVHGESASRNRCFLPIFEMQ